MLVIKSNKATGACNECDRRITKKVKSDTVQFGFVTGKGTASALWQMQEKYGSKGNKVYIAFMASQLLKSFWAKS